MNRSSAALLSQIAGVYVSQGDDEATGEVLRKALEYNARSASPSVQLDASANARLAYMHYQAGHDPLDRRRLEDAVQQLRALGAEARSALGLALIMQANLLLGESRRDEAAAISAEAVQILEPLGDAHAWEYLWALLAYADMLASLDRSDESLAAADKGLAHAYLQLPEGATLRQDLLGTRARGLAGLRRYAEAEPALAQVIDGVVDKFGFEHSLTRYWRYRRIEVLGWMGRLDDANVEIEALLGTPASNVEHPMAPIAHRVEALNIDGQRRVPDVTAKLEAARKAACAEHGAAQFCAKVNLIDVEIALRSNRDAAGARPPRRSSRTRRSAAVLRLDDDDLLRADLRAEGRFDEGARCSTRSARADVSDEFVAEIDVEQGFLALAIGDHKTAAEALRRGRTYIAQPLAKLTPPGDGDRCAIAWAERAPRTHSGL